MNLFICQFDRLSQALKMISKLDKSAETDFVEILQFGSKVDVIIRGQDSVEKILNDCSEKTKIANPHAELLPCFLGRNQIKSLGPLLIHESENIVRTFLVADHLLKSNLNCVDFRVPRQNKSVNYLMFTGFAKEVERAKEIIFSELNEKTELLDSDSNWLSEFV